ncbi:MAG: SRPBCC family protein [Dehalococcoidia bacterium]
MYHFVTRWFFEASMENVWDKLTDIESWPTWWKGIKKAMIRVSGTMSDPTLVAECKVKGDLPYTFRFSLEVTTFRRPDLVEFKSWGDLVGSGKATLEPAAGGTECTIYWDVRTAKTILNLLVSLPLAKGLVEKNYYDLMDNGYQALKRALEE